jgi:divalent metal cation (Fe/Co/Zn/Cd) transporter
VLGLLTVFVFMLIGHTYNLPYMDGIASVLVGLLLVFVSAILARESRSLLMGEGIARNTQHKIRVLAEKDEAVIRVVNVLSTYQAPDDVVLMLIVEFDPDIDTEDITASIERVRLAIKTAFPLIKLVFVQPQTYTRIPSSLFQTKKP